MAQLTAGPFQRVYDTTDPYDDAPNALNQGTNGRFLATTGPSGFYGRPGVAQNATTITAATGGPCAFYEFKNSDGTVLKFAAVHGKLYRLDAGGGSTFTATDVTPVGVTIAAAAVPAGRYYMNQMAGQLIFTDGVNRPWLGSALTATPITGTYINVDGLGGIYVMQGAPTIYQGSVVFIAASVPGGSSVTAGIGLVWSEPNQPSVGYVQAGYLDFFNFLQTGTTPVYTIFGRNEGLYLFREYSITMAVGPLANLRSSPTSATIAFNIGTRAPASLAAYGETIYFVDRFGRPYRIPSGGAPVALWEQLRGVYDRSPSLTANPIDTAYIAQTVVIPALALVLFLPYSSRPGNGVIAAFGAVTAYAFDADSGQYVGTWSLTNGTPTMDAVAIMQNPYPDKTETWWVLQDNGAGTYFLWQQAIEGNPSYPGTTDYYDVTQAGGSIAPTVSATTMRIGYNAAIAWNWDRLVAVVMGNQAAAVTVQTPYQTATAQGSPTPGTSNDSTYRLIAGLAIRAARGAQVTVTPANALTRWGLQSVTLIGAAQRARPEDP